MKLSTTLSLVAGCLFVLGTSSAFGNLVTNGDFEQGGVGFGTQYQVAFGNTGETGRLTVTSAPTSWNTSFTAPIGAGGTGQMLVANGSAYNADRVWYSTILVQPNTTYQVSFQAVSLNASAGLPTANLGFYYGMPDNPFIMSAATPSVTLTDDSKWNTIAGSFTTGAAGGTIAVLIGNLQPSITGNDFAIDNITVVPEPSTLALLGFGSLIGLGVYVRRRRNG